MKLMKLFLCICFCSLFSGCSSPSSVLPILEHVNVVLDEQIRFVDHQLEKEKIYLAQVRDSLRQGFQNDLDEHASDLEREWVWEAVQVYAVAIESLKTHELEQQQRIASQVERIKKAKQAQSKAISLIKLQDGAIQEILSASFNKLQTDK